MSKTLKRYSTILRNLYYSTLKNNKLTLVEEVKDFMLKEFEIPKYLEETKKEHLEKVFNNVDSVMDTWYWYDRKMFELYYEIYRVKQK
jgi:hypothetical protein